ncbi:MAG: phage baseplate assembly protein V [Novosphingobium sp.]
MPLAELDGDLQMAQMLEREASGFGGRFYGVMPAIVTNVRDPDGAGRIEISLPSVFGGSDYRCWARQATLFAGKDRGSWFLPDKDDEVLVAFEQGDPSRPYILGGLWNGKDAPPDSASSDSKTDRKQLCSRNGVKITLDDSDGQEKLIMETPGGQSVTLKDGPGAIEIVDSNGNSVKLAAAGITVEAASQVEVKAATVKVSAGMVTVDAGMSKFSGVVQADTVIANSVVSSSYTPGAGNIW